MINSFSARPLGYPSEGWVGARCKAARGGRGTHRRWVQAYSRYAAASARAIQRRRWAGFSGLLQRAAQAQGVGGPPHGLDDEGDVLVQVHPEFLRPLEDVLAVYLPGEGFVLHSLAHR